LTSLFSIEIYGVAVSILLSMALTHTGAFESRRLSADP